MTALIASYGIHGTSTYSKGLFTASVTPWLDLYGQFLYSQPKTDVNYQQYDTGNLVLRNELLFYSGQQYLVSAAAQLPHTTAGFGAEVRPFRKVRIVESWLTDRLHDSGSANSNQILSGLDVSEQTAALLSSSLVSNYNQNEIDIFYNPFSKLVLHGGYRYVWGDARDAVLPEAGLVSSDRAQAAAQRWNRRRDIPSQSKDVVFRRSGRRIERRRLLPDQPVQLPESPRSGALSGHHVAQLVCRFHFAQQPESGAGSEL